jgi:hypothetical protein
VAKSGLKAKFALLAPTRDVDRVPFGSAQTIALTLGPDLSRVQAIRAVFALRKRGVPTLKAKRAIEAVIDGKELSLEVPLVEDPKRLANELTHSGLQLSIAPGRVDDI